MGRILLTRLFLLNGFYFYINIQITIISAIIFSYNSLSIFESKSINNTKVISEIPKEKYKNIFKVAYERPEKYITSKLYMFETDIELCSHFKNVDKDFLTLGMYF